MAPELQILAINAAALATGYLGLYPGLVTGVARSAARWRVAAADAGVCAAALATSGALFWDSGQRFSLLLLETNWFGFALISLIALELPLGLWFLRRHGLIDDDAP